MKTLTQEFTFNVEELIEDQGTVDDIYECLFILPDGTMINGDFCDGVRGTDHALMFTYVGIDIYRENYKGDYWELVHDLTGAVRLVAETGYGLIKEGQILSEEQRELLDESGFTVEEY